MLLSALRFTSKKTGELLVRFDYIFTDKETKSDTKNGKGYFPKAAFTSKTEVLDQIPIEAYGKQCLLFCEDRSYPGNPLETRKVVTKIEFDGKTFDLV